MSKKILALWLSVVLMISSFSFGVFAENEAGTLDSYCGTFTDGVKISNNVLTDSELATKLGISVAALNSLRNDIYNAVDYGETTVDIKKYNITASQTMLRCIIDGILDQMPEFLLRYVSCDHNGRILTILHLTSTQNEFNDNYDKLIKCYQNANRLLIGIIDSPTLTDVEKILLVHDRLALNCEYDYQNYLNEKNGTGAVPWESHCMYGPLVKGVGVCDGYSDAFMFMLRRLGIECYLVRSQTMDHAWNMVVLNGKRYYVDVTWDDPTWDVTGQVLHDNLLVSIDGFLAAGHYGSDYDHNTITDKTYDNYYWKNSHSAFALLDDEIYYIDSTNQYLYHRDDNTSRALTSVRDTWTDTYYGTLYNCARLGADGDLLYISQAKKVLSYNPETNQKATFFVPANSLLNQGYNIFGFEVGWENFYYEYSKTLKYDGNVKQNMDYRYNYIENSIPQYLRVKTPLKNNVYYMGSNKFDFSGLSVTVVYSNLTTTTVSTGFGLYKIPTKLGEQYAYITCVGQKLRTKIMVYNSGDANNDGVTNTTDLALLKKKIANLGGSVSTYADMDGNGLYNTSDLAILKKRIAGL